MTRCARTVGGLVAAIMVAVAVGCGSSSSATEGLFLMRPDGSHLMRVMGFAGEIVWTSDGRHLAASTAGFCPNDLYVFDDDDGDSRRVARDKCGEIAWSPDGGRIAYARLEDCSPACVRETIVVIRRDGSSPSVLHDGSAPAWSPDGRSIAFVWRSRSAQQHLWLIHPDGSGLRRPIRADAGADHPAWSPDGSRIAFETPAGIVVARADGGSSELVMQGKKLGALSWSPDGRRLAFAQTIVLRNRLSRKVLQVQTRSYVLDVDRRAVRRLDGDAESPSWSPDGMRLAFESADKHCPATACVFSYRLADGRLRRLTTPRTLRGTDTYPVWSPDGSWIAFVRLGDSSSDGFSTADWIANALLATAAAAVFTWIIVGHYRKRAERVHQGLPADDPNEGSIWEIFIPFAFLLFVTAVGILGIYVGSLFGGYRARWVGGTCASLVAVTVFCWILIRRESPRAGARTYFAVSLWLLSVPVGWSVGAYVKSLVRAEFVWLTWLAATCALAAIFLVGCAVFLWPQWRHGRVRSKEG